MYALCSLSSELAVRNSGTRNILDELDDLPIFGGIGHAVNNNSNGTSKHASGALTNDGNIDSWLESSKKYVDFIIYWNVTDDYLFCRLADKVANKLSSKTKTTRIIYNGLHELADEFEAV